MLIVKIKNITGMVYWPLDKIGEAHGDAALFRVGNSPPSEHDNSEMRIDG